jgi:hypothetical protein
MTIQDVNRVVFDLSFVTDGLKELPYDQLQKENYVKLLSILLNRLEACQNEAIKLAYLRFLDNAYGDMLDSIASRFFINRGDKSDEDLKASIKLFALRQVNQGTRADIINILKVLTANGFVKIYKGLDNYIEVCISIDCVNVSEIKSEIEAIFPVNTNLKLCSVPIVARPFGVRSEHSSRTNEESKVGALGSIHDSPTGWNNIAAVTHVDDEYFYKG